ncbi:hypothetical protein DFO47_101342 [Arthrobacter sp. AG258]|nr:hypothetical protein DFO47_101342 [Arthrobacter sp. AG258]
MAFDGSERQVQPRRDLIVGQVIVERQPEYRLLGVSQMFQFIVKDQPVGHGLREGVLVPAGRRRVEAGAPFAGGGSLHRDAPWAATGLIGSPIMPLPGTVCYGLMALAGTPVLVPGGARVRAPPGTSCRCVRPDCGG